MMVLMVLMSVPNSAIISRHTTLNDSNDAAAVEDDDAADRCDANVDGCSGLVQGLLLVITVPLLCARLALISTMTKDSNEMGHGIKKEGSLEEVRSGKQQGVYHILYIQ